MKGFAAALLGIVLLSSFTAFAADKGLSLKIGAFSQDGDYLKQVISVTNSSGRFYRWVTAECGFFDHDRLVAANQVLIQSLDNGATGFGNAIAYAPKPSDKVDHVQCRLVRAE